MHDSTMEPTWVPNKKREVGESAQFKGAVKFTYSEYYSRITLRPAYIQITNTTKQCPSQRL